MAEKVLDFRGDPRPKRFGWAPGKYMGRCHGIGCKDKSHEDALFIGDKRAISCADCAYALPDFVFQARDFVTFTLSGCGYQEGLIIKMSSDGRQAWITKGESHPWDERWIPVADGMVLLSRPPPIPPRALTTAEEAIGKWLSAALEDPTTCEAMKLDVRAWFSERGIT